MEALTARNRWLAELETRGCSAKTLALYRSHTAEALASIAASNGCAAEHLRLEQVDRDAVVAALSQYRGRADLRTGQRVTRSGASVSSFFTALRSFLAWCVQTEKINRNPASAVRAPKIPARVPKALSLDICRELVLAADATSNPARDGLAVRLALMAGLRLSEIAGLQVSSFSPVAAQATHLRVIGTGNKERSVPIAEAVGENLKKYLQVRAALAEEYIVEGEALLLARPLRGRAAGITENGLGQVFERVVVAAGVKAPGVRAHMARHSFATHLLTSGAADIMEVKELLGHASVATTQVYLKVDPARMAISVQRNPLACM